MDVDVDVIVEFYGHIFRIHCRNNGNHKDGDPGKWMRKRENILRFPEPP